MDSEDLFGILLGALGSLLVSYMALFMVLTFNGERRCLEAGWRDSSTTWNLARYCIARTDQSDIVKPLSWAEANPR